MKILTVRGKNLASIAGEFEINFTTEPLRSAGIFAICGATGAGKSTILDAICLALFNNTPRTSGSENIKMPDVGKEQVMQGDKRQILRRGSTDAYAEVDFLAIDGKSYRAHWQVRRANNKISGKLQPVDWRVYDIKKNQEIASRISESESKLRELSGMTYEQFTRTVLLAQNEFARFLKARKDEKAEVLEKLTGTEIYSVISNTIYNKTATIRAGYKQLCDRLSDIHLLTAEEQEKLVERRSALEQQEIQADKQRKEMLQQLEWLEQYARLSSEVSEAANVFQQARQALENAQPQKEWLRQVEATRSALQPWQNRQTCLSDLKKQQTQLQQRLQESATLETTIGELKTQKEEAIQQLGQRTQAYKLLMPVLKQAREKDSQIENAIGNSREYQKKQKEAFKKRNDQETSLAHKKQELQTLQQQASTLESWFEKNRKYEQMCQSMDMITGFLDTAYTSTLKIREIEKNLHQLNSRQETVSSDYTKLANIQNDRQDTLTILRKQRSELEKQLSTLDLSHIRNTRNSLSEQKEYLRQCLSLLQTLNSFQEKAVQTQNICREKQEQHALLSQEAERKTLERDKCKLQAETASELYAKAQTAASENILALRSQLQPGTPCPVCGSCEHPTAQHAPTETTTLQTLKEECKKYNTAYEQLNNSCIRISQDLVHLQSQTTALQEELSVIQKNCEDVAHQLKEHHSLHAGQEKQERMEQAEEQLANVERALKTIDNQEKQCEILSQHLLQTNKEIDQTTASLEECQKKINQVKEEQNLLSAELLKEKSLLNHWTLQAEEALNKIKDKIAVEDWRNRWESDCEQFRKDLADAATKWQNKRQAYETASKSIQQLEIELTEGTRILETLRENEKETATHALRQEEIINTLKNERLQLLNGKAADETEQEHLKEIDEIREKSENIGVKIEKTNTSYQQLKGEIHQMETTLETLEKQEKDLQQQLTDWLQRYNTSNSVSMDESALMRLLEVTPGQIDEERDKLHHLTLQTAKAETSLKERQIRLEQHKQDPNRPKEEEDVDNLRQNIHSLQQKIEATKDEKTEISVTLRNHEQNNLQAGSLQKELEQQTQIMGQWAKLDDLVGSQSGYKFKEIAQGFTLDVLLRYANKQLQELTPRYQLQRVPNELAIQIIDHDMCDEVRSVFSLSGGESFLVSLALALGLSSFSSQNHHEENLFIDEGFGTLDAETLQTVMETLERLRSQGRKVGVISHIREMAERIPVQIRLEKAGNGKSKVKIVG